MNLVKAVQVLADAGVDFVIIGGWAAILPRGATLLVGASKRHDRPARLGPSVGLYDVLAYSISARAREVGCAWHWEHRRAMCCGSLWWKEHGWRRQF